MQSIATPPILFILAGSEKQLSRVYAEVVKDFSLEKFNDLWYNRDIRHYMYSLGMDKFLLYPLQEGKIFQGLGRVD